MCKHSNGGAKLQEATQSKLCVKCRTALVT